MEIAPARTSRLAGLIGYILLVAAVASLVVFLFVQFTGSWKVAVVLVGCMLLYMMAGSWWAGGAADRRNE